MGGVSGEPRVTWGGGGGGQQVVSLSVDSVVVIVVVRLCTARINGLLSLPPQVLVNRY